MVRRLVAEPVCLKWYTGVRFGTSGGCMGNQANVVAMRPTVRRRQVRTRDRILAESASLFISRGFANVSVEEIIAAAGIARSSFYRFFSNREDVLTQIIRPVFEQGTRALKKIDTRDPRATMVGLFNAYLEVWERSPDALRLSTRVGGVHFSLFRDLHNDYRLALLALLGRAEAAGILLNDDADASGRLIARCAVPVLEVYADNPRQAELFHLTMSGLLIKAE